MRMEEGEDIISYFQRVKIVVNEVKNQRGTIIDEDFMEKILRTLPNSYRDKI